MTTYSIKDWDKHFENHDTRKRCKNMSWVKIPNKHDGKGWRRLTGVPGASGVFGAFIAAVEVASKMPVRGVLEDEDGPLDAEDMEMKTGLPAEDFQHMFDVLSDPQFKVGWIVAKNSDENAGRFAATAADCGTLRHNRIEERRIEEKREEKISPPQQRQNDSSSDKFQIRTITEEFKRQCEWTGAPDFPYRHFREALKRYTEEQLTAEIARAGPGDMPWDITNRLAAEKTNNWIPKGVTA